MSFERPFGVSATMLTRRAGWERTARVVRGDGEHGQVG
jgi:hypothetical protein